MVATRNGLNTAYYGKEVGPTDILVRHDVMNAQAKGLTNTVARSASKEAMDQIECLGPTTSKNQYGG